MTAPLADSDPAPEQPWRETSSPGIRRIALQAAAEAVRKAKGKPATTTEETTA